MRVTWQRARAVKGDVCASSSARPCAVRPVGVFCGEDTREPCARTSVLQMRLFDEVIRRVEYNREVPGSGEKPKRKPKERRSVQARGLGGCLHRGPPGMARKISGPQPLLSVGEGSVLAPPPSATITTTSPGSEPHPCFGHTTGPAQSDQMAPTIGWSAASG